MVQRRLHIKRYGGPLPMMRPETSCAVADLPAEALTAIEHLMRTPPGAGATRPSARIADGFSYAISLEENGAVVASVTLPESAVPESLGDLLP